MAFGKIEESILRALRRITRAIDLHSRHLANTFGLTGPQLVCLRAIGYDEGITPSALAKKVALSQPTITGIVDRLVTRQLVKRDRSDKDRRVISLNLSKAGRELIQEAPSPLQEWFLSRLHKLSLEEQENILTVLKQVVNMMDSEGIEAAPVLSTSATAMSKEEIEPIMDVKPADVLPVATICGMDLSETDEIATDSNEKEK